MNSEGRNLGLAILTCVLFFLAYNQYMTSKYGEQVLQQQNKSSTEATKPTEAIADTKPTETSRSTSAKIVAKTDSFKRLSPTELTFETDEAVIVFNQDSSSIQSARLKEYRQTKSKDSGPVELLSSPLTLQGSTNIQQTQPHMGFHGQRKKDQLTFWRQDGPWRIEQTFSFPQNGYGGHIDVTYTNTTDQYLDLSAALLMSHNVLEEPSKDDGGLIPSFVTQQNTFVRSESGALESVLTKEYCSEGEHNEPALKGRQVDLDYLGFDSHYFLAAVLPETKNFSYFMQYNNGHSGDGCPMVAMTYQPQGQVGPNQAVTMKYELYLGPKEVNALAAFDDRLESSIDLGWFGVIAHPLLLSVKSFYNLFGNYGLAIILITLLLKIIFYPLTKASVISMKKMQKLQPQMAAIREQHKDDPRMQQQELMRFMQVHKVNPAKGCLPILPQIPVFIAFYNVLSHAIELRHAPFFGWLQDLSAADPYFITPILLGVGMFMQQKLTPNPSMDKNQEKIMLMMPVIFTVMMLSLPAGMVLYMIVNTVVSIAQQQWLNRRVAV